MIYGNCELCQEKAEWHVMTVRQIRQLLGDSGWELSMEGGTFHVEVCSEHLMGVLSENKDGDYHCVYHSDKTLPDSFEYARLMEVAFKQAAKWYPEHFEYAFTDEEMKAIKEKYG